MKKSSATGNIITSDQLRITKSFTNDFLNQKQVQDASRSVGRPSEETIIRLNQIGHEYPFCVYYKQKLNDPL